MKFRRFSAAIALSATAALSITGLTPAQADPADPIVGLAVVQTQVGQALKITATWTANPDVVNYRTYLSDETGDVLAFKDGSATTATLTTEALAAGQDYKIGVKAIKPAYGPATLEPFTAIDLDTDGPVGTYSLNRTTAYLEGVDFDEECIEEECEEDYTAAFVVTQNSLTDASTPADDITRTIEAGDGSSPKAWTAGTFTLKIHQPGTFTPKVHLTDEFGNTRTVLLTPVTAQLDTVAPKVSIKVPANPTKVASWRYLSGTATDVGTGVEIVLAFVVQKRGLYWYAYDFEQEIWIREAKNLTDTLNNSEVTPAIMEPKANGVWKAPYIKGLLKGTTHVEAAAFDQAFNLGEATPRNPVLR